MAKPPKIQLNAASVDLDACRITCNDGTQHRLTPSEASLLRYLSERPGRVITKDELLQQVWGYKPGIKSRTCDTTVGRLRTKIEADPKAPEHLITVFGSGFRFDAPELEVAGLFGRVDDMRALLERTDRSQLVVLVGPAGVGKTALARGWGERRPGVDWIDFSGAETLNDFISAVLEVVDGKLGEGDPIMGAVPAIARQPRTLVLDNLDTVTDAASRCLAVWLAEAPELRIIATSRTPLQLPSEDIQQLELLPHTPAAELFRARALAVDPDLALSDPVVGRIVNGLEGNALAIELAAARLHVLSPEALVDRVASFAHRDLAESVRRSWELLSPTERQVLSDVSLFRSTFDARAAEAVVTSPSVDVLQVLAVLRQRSLIQGNRGALRLYEAVRHFAAEQGQHPEAVLKWGRWLAERTDPRWSRDQTAAFRRLGSIEPDTALKILLQRVTRHLQLGENQAAYELTGVVESQVKSANPTGQAHGWLARALALRPVGRYEDAVAACAHARDADPDGPLVARAWFEESVFHMTNANLDRLATCLDRAEALTTDPDLRLRIAVNRANLARIQGQTEAALKVLKTAMETNRGAPVTIGLATLEVHYGSALMESGRPDLAEAMLLRAERHLQQLERNSLMVIATSNRAEALRTMGRFDEARPLYQSAIDAVLEGKALAILEPILLVQLSSLEQEVEDFNQAAQLANRALLSSASSDRYRAIASVQVGSVHHERGWHTLAKEAYLSALNLINEVGDERVAALIEGRLACLEASEDAQAAQVWLDAAIQHAGDDPQLALPHQLFGGQLALARGEQVEALLATAEQPLPGDPAPSPAAWNSEVRFAAKMLRLAQVSS